LARKVLLADDSVTAQNMGRKILTDAGYEVVTVNNGSAALKKISEAHPDLIVLDVYMPGYSGLEVCQRIKESRETNQIPVLLTVGKLEPFKQDEARRVRADAFIIKPFEASELTAALSKLEGKLGVPVAPRKEGRASAPATMESFERTATSSAPQFGDEQSGWKARLKFPSAGSKPTQVEPDPEPYTAPSTSFRDAVPDPPAPLPQNSPVHAVLERPIPAGIPQDITPDEIAAIAAAAARVQAGISVGENFEHLTASPAASKPEDAAPKAEDKAAAAVVEESSQKAPAPEVTSEKSHRIADSQAPVETLASSSRAMPTDTQTQNAVQQEGAAAQAQAAPDFAELSKSEPVAVPREPSEPGTTFAVVPGIEETAEPEPVAVAAIGASSAAPTHAVATLAPKTRWVAEEVPLEAQEAVLVLEREMHKAYAAFAAAEHGLRYDSAPIDRDDEPIFAAMSPPAIGTPLPMMEPSGAAKPSRNEALASNEPTQVPAGESTFREVANSSHSFKPPAPSFAPVGPSRDDTQHAAAAFGGPEPFGMAEASPISEREHSARSSSPSETKMEAPVPQSSAAIAQDESSVQQDLSSATPGSARDEAGKVERNPAEPSSDVHPEPDFAAATRAAWANWRDVRESVLSPKAEASSASRNPEAELEELKKLKGLKKDGPSPSTLPEAALAAAASADTSATSDSNLSSIVDTMLAELKPKLMAELAEKLKQEKKK
jgi:twitching motility two-component system response regulator PilH